ncbi:autophagy-related protein 17 [Annulohypoxylon maeteangense]|uniref:autophagy-related protein 17 n=1 Tax=Annulohypoxylon maeteangense TaxID=1927788 RepID=UPI0020089613|nr:autophagy-related protein 17 [Annulohypoxylon maeteangense]KAI0882007.1 autophagy-related protein 17 [Annulohypoxylon maeteangense]
MASPTRPASSTSVSRSASHHVDISSMQSVPVETLVQYLLDAKRSLSSMGLVWRANELVHSARQAHEESVILAAQSQFIHQGINEQVRLLQRLRRGMNRTYDNGKREFKQIIKTLDAANGRLVDTMKVLRDRIVDSTFRPKGEEKKSLLDFVDESQVDAMRDALKENIQSLQNTQKSFDGDLLRFDTDMRLLQKTMPASLSLPSPSASTEQIVPRYLASMVEHSHNMAELLSSLTKHFDLCVTAVRTTEGGAALARIKAAEVTNSQGGEDMSISGVIAEQESHMPGYDPISAEDRIQMLQVVVQDASEVEDVIRELNIRLQSMEADFTIVDEQTNLVKKTYISTVEAFGVLEDIGSRLQSYISAESEFRERWNDEQQAIEDRLDEMDQLRIFYENYSNSYDGLILELERRKSLDDKVLSIWKKAKESVDKIIEGDRKERERFRSEVAEYLPTDLWPGMDDAMVRWEVVPVREDRPTNTPTLERSVVEATQTRAGRNSDE